MTAAVKSLLETFESLSEAERHEAAVELLRRVAESETPELSDESLLTAADEAFCELDAREAADADA